MIECHKCKSKMGIVCWTEILKEKETGEITSVSAFMPLDQTEKPETMQTLVARYSTKRYWYISKNPEKFAENESRGERGAYCIKCNAKITERR